MLTAEGFTRKSYADILEEMSERARELYGNDVNLTDSSFIGIQLRIDAWYHSKMYELAENVYRSGHPTEAEGVQLDYLTPYFATKRLNDKPSYTYLKFLGEPGYEILADKLYSTPSGVIFYLAEDVILDDIGVGVGLVVCTIVGDIGNVPANSITVQNEPDSSIFSVTNEENAIDGQNYESDNGLVNRLMNSTGTNGSTTTDAIVAAVRSVDAVRSANIIVNRTNVEKDGLPPKSFQVFTLGGDSQEIAKAIFSKMAGGIESFGTVCNQVTDNSEKPQKICFSPAKIVDVFVEVTIQTDSAFSSNGQALIQDEITKAIGGTISDGVTYSGLDMGKKVILFQIEKAIGKVDGVVDASVKIGRDWSTLSSNSLEIGSNEVAQTTSSNISVVVV